MLSIVSADHCLDEVMVVLQKVVVEGHQTSFVLSIDELGTLLMFAMANMVIPLVTLVILGSHEFFDFKTPILLL